MIIHRLSQEPSYPLQLSKDLAVGQQLVTKHLKVMEKADVVTTSDEPSPSGPERKMYTLTKYVSVAVDFAPNLYNTRILSFSDWSQAARNLSARGAFSKDLMDIFDEKSKGASMESYAKAISEIDREIEEIERKRVALLRLRDIVMSWAKRSIAHKDLTGQERKVLYHLLETGDRSMNRISKELGILREDVDKTLTRLKNEGILSS